MTPGSRARAILLSGPVGSGKTTLTIEIGEILERSGVPYALVDLDWLAWLQPAVDATVTVQDVLVRNLRGVWETFRDAGVDRLVLARFVESREQLEAIRAALVAVDLFAIQLAVPRPVLEERLRRRDTGRELAEHLALVALPEPSGLADAVISSDEGRLPHEVARAILATAGWLPDVDLDSRTRPAAT